MIKAEVSRLVHGEIDRDGLSDLPDGTFLADCLVSPRKQSYAYAGSPSSYELWVVLEEDPSSGRGYEVVFSETERRFGLARMGVFLGFYGTLAEAIQAVY